VSDAIVTIAAHRCLSRAAWRAQTDAYTIKHEDTNG